MEEEKEDKEEQKRYVHVENVVDEFPGVILALKRVKRKAKANLTRLLNQVVGLSEENYDNIKVLELVERIEKVTEQTMKIFR